MTIHLGRWEDVLAGVEPHTVIADPPYGERTHTWSRIVNKRQSDDCTRTAIDYAHWPPADVSAFVSSWASRSKCWIVAMTSHDLVPHWMAAYDAAGWYSFPPLGILITGMGVRMGADGPASWTLHLCVARRRAKKLHDGSGKAIWRALPGGYTGPAASEMAGGRGKPAWLCEALVRDYSDPGMLVCDPCAGWGNGLVAARDLGRRWVGAEMDPTAHAVASRVLRGDGRADPRPEQPSLFGGAA